MDFPKYTTTSRASPYSGAMASLHSTGATARGGYSGAIGATDGGLEEYGRGVEDEDAYRYRQHINRQIEGGAGERYRSSPKRQSSGDVYNGHHDERYQTSYHQSVRPVSHHHYDDPRQHYHQQVNHPDLIESRYDHGHGAPLGAWSNQQPVRRLSHQQQHGIAHSKAPPSEYHAADLHGYYQHPPLSQFHPNFSDVHSNDNSLPTLAESDTSDDYYDNSGRYLESEDDSFWNRKPAPGEKVAKSPPPLREKVAGVKTVEVAPGVHLRLRGASSFRCTGVIVPRGLILHTFFRSRHLPFLDRS